MKYAVCSRHQKNKEQSPRTDKTTRQRPNDPPQTSNIHKNNFKPQEDDNLYSSVSKLRTWMMFPYMTQQSQLFQIVRRGDCLQVLSNSTELTVSRHREKLIYFTARCFADAYVSTVERS